MQQFVDQIRTGIENSFHEKCRALRALNLAKLDAVDPFERLAMQHDLYWELAYCNSGAIKCTNCF